MEKKVWYEEYFPVGMTITGETLKELAANGSFDVVIATINNEMIQPEELDFSKVDDKELWIIGLNTNSRTIHFIQLFTENRVIIETSTKPEVKTLPPYDFAYAL